MEDKFYTVKEAAAMCHVKPYTVRHHWIDKCGLKKYQPIEFGNILIKESDLKEFLERRGKGA